MATIFTDIEVYHDFFYVGFKREDDGKRVGVEFSRRSLDYDREFVRRILFRNTTVGYNSLSYDLPMIWYSLHEGVTNEKLKRASDSIIQGGIKWWDVEQFLGISIPYDVKKNHIDLIEPQPNAFASLKTLNGRLHGKRLQDLPYPPETVPTDAQMDIIADYCLHSDLDATHTLYAALHEPLELRKALSAQYGQNFMSKSDSQIGEAIVKKRVEEITGQKPRKVEVRAGTTFTYPIPDWLRFRRPDLQQIVERLREEHFVVKADGKVDLPAWLSNTLIEIGESAYQMGIGGLHSTESNRAVISSNEYVLLDADVASMYPTLILLLKLLPPALGEAFWKGYAEIKGDRLKAKKRGKELKAALKVEGLSSEASARLLGELLACEVVDKGLKIALNGVFGKLGSKYSILYAPQLLLAVTLTGQLALLMLIEWIEALGAKVKSGNTDGVLILCPREIFAGFVLGPDGKPTDRLEQSPLEAITSKWERETGMDLEFAEYRAVYNQSVNSYFAIKADGGHKRKGPISNPWSTHPDDRDPRGQLMKNPQMTICSDAALARIKDGTPVADTIRACTDIRQFVTVIRASKGATWQGEYLGKTVRYYWSTDGEPIYEQDPHPVTGNYKKIPKTDGAAECMTLPDEFPTDIDYGRYVAEAEEILRDIGFYGPKRPPQKRIRITKANREAVLREWMVAA